jgi:hypothetical protein
MSEIDGETVLETVERNPRNPYTVYRTESYVYFYDGDELKMKIPIIDK